MKLYLFIIISFLSLPILGQGFSFSTYYDDDDYVGFITNWAAIQDTNGSLYFGIGDGVQTYDGVKWQFNHIGPTGRGTNFHIASDNTFYVSAQYDFGVFEHNTINQLVHRSLSDIYYADKPRTNPHFSSVEVDSAVYLYGTIGIDVFKDTSYTHMPYGFRFHNRIFKFEESVYITHDVGISRLDGNEKVDLNIENYPDTGEVTFMIPVQEERILLGFGRDMPHWFDGSEISPFEIERGQELVGHYPFDGVIINDSLIAIATVGNGIYFYDLEGKLKKIFNEKSGADQNEVYDLFLDNEETLWLGTAEYIEKLLVSNPVAKFDETNGIELYNITQIGKEGTKIWVSSGLGIRTDLFSGTIIEPENVFSFQSMGSAANIIQGNNRVYFFDGSRLKDSDGSVLLNASQVVQVRNYDDPNTLLIIADQEILELKGKEFISRNRLEEFRISSAVQFNDVVFLQIGSEGIYKVVEDSMVKIPFYNEISGNVRYKDMKVINDSLYVSVQNDIAEGGRTGIYLYDYEEGVFKKSKFFQDLHPRFATDQTSVMEQCENGDIWLFHGGNWIYSTSRISKEDGEWKVTTSPYNLIGEGKGIETILCDNDGESVWFGGIKGLYHLTDPDWEYTSEFKTNITGMYLHQDSLVYGGFGEPEKDLVFPYEDNQVRFTYAAASYIDETRNTYSVKMEGFDKDWSEWSKETQKDYTNIPEGDYVFRVRSKNVYEVDGKEDAMAFTVLPPWYRTWWAYVSYFLMISGMLYTAYKIRVNQLLKVERMRTRIASDLHDEVSATLTGISYFAEAIERDNKEGSENRFVSLIRESAGDAKEKITDIVWSINPENDDWMMFLSKCRRYASDLLESKDLKYELKIPEQIHGKLKMEVRQHLWMIFKEMLTNAVRHANATRIDVIMDVDGNYLKLVVQDDGQGFDPVNGKKGNGVSNIRKRADQIRASIDLDSENGFGTRWVMRLPLQ